MKQAERYLILIIALILLHLTGFSQDQKYVKKNLVFKDSAQKPVPISLTPLPEEPRLTTSTLFLSTSTFPAHLGFFCRQEYKLEKAIKLPVKIRLGTYEAAHKLEYGK